MKIIGIRRIAYKKDGQQREFFQYFLDDTNPANGDKGTCCTMVTLSTKQAMDAAAQGAKIGSDVLPIRNNKGYLESLYVLK